ncbi:MAG: UDP-N-acetylmuramoyl-L-alanyl-D-glutamate--2,6-diaminopimelate ligase [Phycisphaerales bacterium JB039]
MRLGDVIAGSGALVKAPGSASVRICDITDDSRTALPGSLFIARRGLTVDGRAFVADAIAAGAVAVLTDDPSLAAPGAQVVYAQDLPRAAAVMAETFYGNPSRRLRLIGVTGTNGKTTTTWLIRALLRRLGIGCGLMGTIEVDDGGRVGAASLTTPPATEISRTLACMVDNGLAACAMEVSSHALVQGRAAGLRFDAAVFTNLSGDHLDYHGDLESYAGAKALLFEGLDAGALAIVNADDPVSERMVRDCAADVLRCRLVDEEGTLTAEPVSGTASATIHALTRTGFEATLRGPWGAIEAQVGLVGRHNVMNTLQALCAAWRVAPDARAEDLGAALGQLRAPPGRLEPASGPEDDITVLVDYAHTDDALDKALLAARDLTPDGAQLWVVFGCGGDRDRTKRPRMGAVAGRLADRVVVTSDNPRTESPKAIVEEIIAGLGGRDFEVQVDRERAIQHAVSRAQRGDVIVIAGKGHEDYQILPDGEGGTFKRHFDDREVARDALRLRAQAGAVTS